jgi:predicted GNAT family N-acyltransferase
MYMESDPVFKPDWNVLEFEEFAKTEIASLKLFKMLKLRLEVLLKKEETANADRYTW